jgi:glycosyltransferase involved in cell wall biosynthesis
LVVQHRPLSDDATAFLDSVARDGDARIVYFSESILPWVDGVSRTLGQLFDDLTLRGREFRVYAPIEASDEYRWSGNVRTMHSMALPFHSEYRVSLPDKRKLVAELDAFGPDLIHVCAPTPAGVWAQSYARSRDIPVVGSFHTHFVAYFRYFHAGVFSRPAWCYLRWFYNRCDATFAPSRSMAAECEAHGISNARSWSRGIDTQRFSRAYRDEGLRAGLGVDAETPLLLMVSRLVKEKDLDDLMTMDRLLKQRGLAYRLALVGKGPYEGALRRKLTDAIFAGQQVGAVLSRWYASGDIFVFPSTTEAFGNVVQEAMASELATVVVDAGGPPGIMEDGVSGLVARPNNPRDLADKVESLIRDAGLRRRLGTEARTQMLGRTWDRVNGGLLNDYEEIRRRYAGVGAGIRKLRRARA